MHVFLCMQLDLRWIIVWQFQSTTMTMCCRHSLTKTSIWSLIWNISTIKTYTQQAITVGSITLHHSVSTSCFLCSHLTPLPPHQTHLTVYVYTHQQAPTSAPAPTLAAIIRGGAVLSPVSSIRPRISRASAGLCRPLSLTLTLPSLAGSISLAFTSLFHLPWPSGSCSCCPSIHPIPPLLLLGFKLSALTLDLASGLRPPVPGPQLPPAWMELSSGRVWPHVARLSRRQVISSDRCNKLLPKPATLRGWRAGETERRRKRVRVD